MSPTNRSARPLRIDTRLAGYTALAGAALAVPTVAKATVVYSGVVNINIPTTTQGVYLNVATGQTSLTPTGNPGWDLNPWGSGGFFVYANNSTEANNGIISNFTGGSSATLTDNIPLGTIIDGTWTYGRTNNIETTGITAFTLSSSNNLIGFRFLNNVTGQLNFGWARIQLAATLNGQPRAIVEYAFQNDGTAILAGQTVDIPEPSTTALLGVMAAGAVGVRAWRNRKTA